MTNSTDHYWSVDGQSLQTLAYNIVSWGGDRQAPPPVRGANLTVPFRSGQTFLPKVPDQRTMTLAMWVQGCNEDGTVPKGLDQRKQFETNWQKLRALLWQPYRQFTLSKRVLYPDGQLHTVTAQAQYSGGLQLSMTGTQRADFTVDLILADPYFYGAAVTQAIGTSATFQALGDARTTKVSLAIPGARSNPRVTISAAGADPYVQYNGSISAGSNLVLDVDNSIATYYGDGVTQQRTGLVTNGNSFSWFYVDPGTNNVQANGNNITLTYQPAFF